MGEKVWACPELMSAWPVAAAASASLLSLLSHASLHFPVAAALPSHLHLYLRLATFSFNLQASCPVNPPPHAPLAAVPPSPAHLSSVHTYPHFPTGMA